MTEKEKDELLKVIVSKVNDIPLGSWDLGRQGATTLYKDEVLELWRTDKQSNVYLRVLNNDFHDPSFPLLYQKILEHQKVKQDEARKFLLNKVQQLFND